MRIKLFKKLLEQEARDHVLKDCNLVIDGQNYLYDIYEQSKLSNMYGCESDRFAKFLKNRLSMFKKAHIKCYFVFKGGSTDVEKRWEKKTSQRIWYNDKQATIFVKYICRQVMEEMGFDYVICHLEAKQQCAVLANVLQCPVMSNDIEVGILSNSYVNHMTLNFDTVSNSIKCKLLHFNTFLEKYELSLDKFSIFVLLTDETIYPVKYFSKVLIEFKAESLLEQYSHMFKWVSSKSKSEIMNQVLQGFDPKEKERIILKEKEVYALFTPKSPGIPCQYFLQRNRIRITDNDPQWFEKGIALRYIAIPYINLYTDGAADGSWAFKDAALPDAILLSTDIMKYALNLLSNYSRESFTICSDNGNKIEVSTKMPDVPKPKYTVRKVIFENGWSRIEQLNLLKHFLSHTIVGVDFDPLIKLPKDARLLMVALIYMAHKSQAWGEREAYSVMLCFVAMSGKKHNRKAATKILAPYYFKRQKINKDLIYPLFQFQHCLEQMNYLNALCCFSYQTTVFSRTYNAKFVYNILKEINAPEIDAFIHLTNLLNAAPAVATYFKTLVNTHKKIMPFNH